MKVTDMAEPTISRALALKDGTKGWLFGAFQLRSAFQPIFSLKSGKAEIAGYEGLIRPFMAGRALSPALFFGNIEPRDRMRVETVTRDLHLANAVHLPGRDAMLFINIDPSAFNTILDISEALAGIRRLWAKTGKPANRLVCEITEKKVKSPALLFQLADTIRANGFKLAVDDYGAAHSDAERLKRLKPHIVKFDGRWTQRLMATKAGYGQIKAMAAEMHERGIATVFEGIETLEQLELSEFCKATYVQGFALARPEIAPTTFQRFVKAAMPKTVDGAREALREIASGADLEFRPLGTRRVA
jgi:EAL domain-containing protein (putative c-di-GMP-specific phosphodiesterase class I)